MARWFRRGVLGAALLPACGALALAPPAAGVEAAAFIRVVGDFRAEYKRIWKLPIERREVEIASGSGFVIAPGGLILTNHHVVSGQSEVRSLDGEPVQVTMDVTRIEAFVGAGASRRRLPAVVVADDPELDLALLSVTTGELPYVPFGDSDAVVAGEPARVLGFPFGGRVEVARTPGPGVAPDVTVSAGRVAASRSDDSGETRFLQTDATVNPGSSGGPMLDGDGYAIGVVRSKLARAEGAGFAIPIERVKDFLEANGYLSQLPARRLRLGPPQSSDWKRIRLRLPERIDDVSRSRLRLAGGRVEEDGLLVVDRVASPLPLAEVEQALLSGELGGLALRPGTGGGAPAFAATPGVRGRFGSALGEKDARSLRVEYAIYDLGPEKLVARFVAPPDQVAFNLSVVRGALASLEAERLRTAELRTPPSLELVRATLRDPRAPAVPVPAAFVTDETPSPNCPGVGAPDSSLQASPAGDFAVAFRVDFFGWDDGSRRAAAAACPEAVSSVRLGVAYRSESRLVSSPDGLLRLEAEAPQGQWGLVEPLARVWLEAARGVGQ